MNKYIAVYLRVSTKDQDVQMQLDEIIRYLNQEYPNIPFKVYEDVGWSGKIMKRPSLSRAMDDVSKGLVSHFACYRIDRVARSLKGLVNTIEQLEASNVPFISVKERIDLSKPIGRLLLGVLGSVAEFERNIISERVTDGMAKAKLHGCKPSKKDGIVRGIGRPKQVKETTLILIKTLASQGYTFDKIQEKTKVSRGTISRVLKR